ncbi:hypothetical protein NR800_22310 [Corallococcus interemptor]|uniref:hypothetical protein n=1 Tax=Corallococcus interemptor TaxID=2316720 RepID=UPI0035D47A64
MTDSFQRIDPRPEARPLPFQDFTEEQREAGERATSLLRGMSREHWERQPSVPSGGHSYLPVLYKERRSNRVVLLDGARGSGKSALLVSLLDAYGSVLTEQLLPPDYEAWIHASDRVVPVGLVDLQPLPPTTHLLFHLVAHLERVVEAIESRQNSSQAGVAAWHPASMDDAPSRKRWRTFARAAASGWEDNLDARKSKLDAEAFAVEVEQGELFRMDVTKAFREFVDALVEDYCRWIHWQSGTPPLFVLAIDDADMNPDLANGLLELLRKLWHPRLGFLLTGNSELFLQMLDEKRPGLGADIYTKVIPPSHRCLLQGLSLRQRLDKNPPGLRELLRRIPLEGPANPARPTRSLLDYFEGDAQTLELLPDRLRYLLEWGAQLAPGPQGSGPMRSDVAVWRIWRGTLAATNLLPAQREGLEKRLWIENPKAGLSQELTGLQLRWASFEPLGAVHFDSSQLVLTRPRRLEASLKDGVSRGLTTLPPPIASVLTLALNVIADAERHGSRPHVLESRLSTALLAAATFDAPDVLGGTSVAWPLPEWTAPLDLALVGNYWSENLAKIQMDSSAAAEEITRAFLDAVITTGIGREARLGPEAEKPAFNMLASELVKIARQPLESQRRFVLREWAIARAGLLAAPESGLPPDVANAWLFALRDGFGDDWSEVRVELRASRLRRIQQIMPAAKPATIAGMLLSDGDESTRSPDANAMVVALDKRFGAHEFARAVVSHSVRQLGNQQLAERFIQDLRNVYLPSLNRVLGDRGNLTLANYLTPLRRRWLQGVPPESLGFVQQRLEVFSQIQDAAAPALANLWHASCEAEQEERLFEVVRLVDGRLVIEKRTSMRLAKRRAEFELTSTGLDFHQGNNIYEVLIPTSVTKSMLFSREAHAPEDDELLEVMFRMAYDHVADTNEQVEEEGKSSPVGWKGLLLLDAVYSRLNPWPVPKWPSLYEWESLEERWKEIVEVARQAGGPVSFATSSRILDSLAFWLFSYCQALQSRSEGNVSFVLEPTPEDWRRVLRGEGRARFKGREVRSDIYAPWRQRLPLMATPEAGLSDNAATRILAVIWPGSEFNEFKELLDKEKGGWEDLLEALKTIPANQADWERESKQVRPEILNSLRREWLVQAGMQEDKVESFLTETDLRNPTHPWVQIVGPWTPPKPPPPT